MKKFLFRAIVVSILLMGINAKGFCADNAVMIDETRMQKPLEIKEHTNKKIEKLNEKYKEELEKEKAKLEKENIKKAEKENKKAEKEAQKEAKIKAKEDEENQKEQVKQAEKQAKEEAKQAKNDEVKEENKEETKEASKEENKQETNAEASDKKAEKTSEGEGENSKTAKDENETTVKEEKEDNIKEVSDNKSKEEATEKKEEGETKAKAEENKEENQPADDPALYRKNLTFADIDKNAVSINEFLGFTDKQNEKFSIFYYKTTSKLNAYTKQINLVEAEIKKVKEQNLGNKTRYDKLKKLDKTYDYLLRERDDFYNKSLDKFNSMLTKKQAIKWELLQQMGYRFLPSYD